jgi:Fe/S biogenesis protein NfuA
METLGEEEVKARIQKILDEMINPAVASHGGYVELLDVKENIAYLKLGGGCQGCGMVNVTLKQGIETTLKEEIPQLVGVIDQTDHAGGANPYYQPAK